MKEEKKLQLEKKKAFYNAAYAALVDNCMEIDKQLLYLSSAAIGLLITFFLSKIENFSQLILWLLSVLLFILTIIVIFIIFVGNNRILQNVLNDEKEEISLSLFDKISKTLFVIAVLLTFILSITILNNNFVLHKINQKQELINMSQKKEYQNSLDKFIKTQPKNKAVNKDSIPKTGSLDPFIETDPNKRNK